MKKTKKPIDFRPLLLLILIGIGFALILLLAQWNINGKAAQYQKTDWQCDGTPDACSKTGACNGGKYTGCGMDGCTNACPSGMTCSGASDPNGHCCKTGCAENKAN